MIRIFKYQLGNPSINTYVDGVLDYYQDGHSGILCTSGQGATYNNAQGMYWEELL